MKITVGTSHFRSRDAAVAYYSAYGFDGHEVDKKIAEGEIAIGPPALKPGETLSTIDLNRRYAITSETAE